MKLFRLAFLFIWLSITCVSISAQITNSSPTESQSEKEKAALELEKDALDLAYQTASAAGGLKLWGNRALIYAMAGDVVWKSDQKRARAFFRQASDELVLGNQMPKEAPKNYYEEYSWWQDVSPRKPILLIVAAYDADLALEMLLQTRPPDLQTAVDARSQTPVMNASNKTQVQLMSEQKNKFKVQQEIQLEQQFAVKAAEQDPKKAAKLLRESLAKGFSQSIADLLAKVNEKDEKLGAELLAEILQKLADADFKQKEDAMNLGGYFLRQTVSPENMKLQNPKFKPLKIEDRDLKPIAEKLADYLLTQTDINKRWLFTQMLPAIRKYAPEKVPLLEQKDAEIKKIIPKEWQGWEEVQKLINDPKTTPEKLIDEAEKYTAWEKYELYRTAADRAVAAGNGEKIREILQNLPAGKQRDDAINHLDSKVSDQAIKDDKLDAVQRIITKSGSDSSKVKLLVNLAIGYQKKNTKESSDTALDLMEQARKIIGDFPESREEAGDILKIAAGYAEIAPEKAFPLLNSLTEMTNDLLTAYSLLAKYNKSENMFKQGEMIYTQSLGFGGAYLQYGKEIKMLAKADFGKMKTFTEQFRREDMRILAKMLLARGILKEKAALEGVQPSYSFEGF